MMNQLIYLKPNVIVEPLFNQWYAWSYLISPATAAMYIAHSHLPIMQSFVAAPQVHQNALKNPAMIGGPFINYDSSRVEDIQILLETTQKQQAHLLELAQAIQDLEKILAEHTHGYSLEPLYEKIPQALRGYVELVQDSNNYPSIRFIEGLLYRSPYYNPANQSVNLYLGDGDKRAFVLSTPRLPDEQSIHLKMAFSDRALDQLFQMRHTPQPYEDIRDTLKIKPQQETLFADFFTTTPPKQEPDYRGEAVRVRYFGHACVLIQTESISILCDPIISYPDDSGDNRYTYQHLPPVIDYVLITHNHQDHIMLETLLQLRHKIQTVVVPKSNKGTLIDPSLKLMLQQIGFKNVREIDELEVIHLTDGYITGLPFLGEHGDLNIATKAAYLINLKGRSILCAADSNNIDPQLYSHLQQIFGDIDVLFIGMECGGAPYTWAYGALLTNQVPRKIAQTRRLDGSDSSRAIALVQQLHPQQVYIYAMGQEPWLTFITSIIYTAESKAIIESNQLIAYCHSQEILSKRLFGCEEIFLIPNPKTSSIIGNIKTHTLLQPEVWGEVSSIQSFLFELQRLDIRIWLEDTDSIPKLRCNAPKGVLKPTLKAQLQERKSEIIEFLQNSGKTKVEIDWEQETTLDSTIIPPSSSSLSPAASSLLLTGATGFIGAFLLQELLNKTTASIYCLIRAENIETAKQRIVKTLQNYQIWHNSYLERIIPIVGDLAKPKLGLSALEFANLANQIDVIYHNGAKVNHTEPYNRLKTANVLGTQEIFRLASQSKLKPVHLISSTSIFADNNNSNLQVTEDDNLDKYGIPIGGYAQSKWAAEKLAITAINRGIPVKIYRLGAVSGDSKTGAFNQDDFLYKLLLGYVQLGSIPDTAMPLEILPVDYVCSAIIELSKIASNHQIFHIIQPKSVSSEIIFEQLKKIGFKIEKISYQQWRNKILEIAQKSPEHILYPLISLLPRQRTTNESQPTNKLKIDNRKTQNILNQLITPPSINENLIQTYLSHLIQQNLIKKPPSNLRVPLR
ncbi:thioester reductase domain-containing protein [Nodularia spumigena]|uniref:thioester reductase domain-containing protein n=1 Tax=Nodularia spumigena TaxID=70799 RepID=UPI00232DF87B|nr:thioester reductase domain-containing protein [Nodularia spumigena]MDB9316587.1 thioester reductase domain-containing protein [Nodularia spumigena CS-590/01A]MDB9325412.1 thioester reductase domain-containing protein [Nodularia spumigena CS-590/02]MDB9335968.1 thioester reductase domain-containing protein [Nodularia spumigena CS-590/01]